MVEILPQMESQLVRIFFLSLLDFPTGFVLKIRIECIPAGQKKKKKTFIPEISNKLTQIGNFILVMRTWLPTSNILK